MKISYAITVCNEFYEIQRLIHFLIRTKRPQDEIVVQMDLSKDDIKIEKDIIDESQLYFDNDDIICVYVKVGKVTEGGKNTTYKSTHKKVNIMNKNKTIIERIVYIDNNKNKFIKFNKKYESLSTFKYNRKNKYYYI